MRRPDCIVACVVALAAAWVPVARADVLRESRMFQWLLLRSESNTREYTSSDRRCTEYQVRSWGLDGKPFPGVTAVRVIVRLDLGLVWEVREQDTTYTETSFAVLREAWARAGYVRPVPQRVSGALRSGRREQVAGRAAERVDIEALFARETPEAGAAASSQPPDTAKGQAWIAADFPECGQLRAFESRCLDSLRGCELGEEMAASREFDARLLAASGLQDGCVLGWSLRLAIAERPELASNPADDADSLVQALRRDWGSFRDECVRFETVPANLAIYELPRGYRRRPSDAELLLKALE